MTFIAEMTKALAWPVAIIVLGLIFRTRITGLLEGIKLKRVKKGDWEADFEAMAREVRAELPSPGAPATASKTSKHVPQEVERLIERAPVAAISLAWNTLEERIAEVAARAGIKQKLLAEILRALEEKGMIQPSVRDAILGLRNMRNLAVHAPLERLTLPHAREFVDMVEATSWSLEQGLKSAAKP
jgi:predicted transcriptional regulator